MNILKRFGAYAEAFEQTYQDDDWSRLEPYFTEDAAMEGLTNSVQGRSNVLVQLRAGVDELDRRMDERVPSFEPPTVEGNTLTMNWSVIYKKAGIPDLVLNGVETAVFEGDQIKHLRDELDAETQKRTQEWMAAHAAKLSG